MPKYIDRDIVVHILTTVFADEINGNPHFLRGIESAKEIIQNEPVVDVAEVVSCRDCEYLTETPWPGSRVYECTWAHQSTTLDDWCSHGRRDDF